MVKYNIYRILYLENLSAFLCRIHSCFEGVFALHVTDAPSKSRECIVCVFVYNVYGFYSGSQNRFIRFSIY